MNNKQIREEVIKQIEDEDTLDVVNETVVEELSKVFWAYMEKAIDLTIQKTRKATFEEVEKLVCDSVLHHSHGTSAYVINYVKFQQLKRGRKECEEA